MPFSAYASLDEFLAHAYRLIAATSVAMGRATGLILVMPVFVRMGLSGLLRAALAFVIAMPMMATVATLVRMTPPMALIGLTAKEMALGALLGFALGIPFWAAEMAGEVIDLQRGSTMAQLVDPSGSQEGSVTATLLHVLMIAMFLQNEGLTFLLHAFYDSYRWWDVTSALPHWHANTSMAVVGLLDGVAHAGVRMVGPLAITVLGVDIVMAYLARMCPRLNTFDLSLPVKNMAFAIALVCYLPFLLSAMNAGVAGMREALAPFVPLTR